MTEPLFPSDDTYPGSSTFPAGVPAPPLPPPPRYPDVLLEWAPTRNPTDPPYTWVDITARLREAEWGYGRNDELAEFETGSGYVLLDNRDRAFDPSYDVGPWYGYIKPRRMFRLTFTWDGVTYPGCLAYARGFPQQWPANGYDSVVRVELVDALGVLEGVDLAVGFSRPAETVDSRINAVLDAVGVPQALRAIDASTTLVAPIEVTATGTSGLAHARQVAGVAGEFGALFVARDGKVTFHNRQRRFNAPARYTFTDDPAGLLYDHTFETAPFDDTYLWNYVRVDGPDPSADTPGIAQDATSQREHFMLVRPIASQLANAPERQSLAEYQVALYKEAALRIPAMPFQGARHPDLMWPALLAAEVSDRCLFVRFHEDIDPIMVGLNVEGIRHTFKYEGPWVTTLATSPADEVFYWVLEGPWPQDEIDSVTVIAP